MKKIFFLLVIALTTMTVQAQQTTTVQQTASAPAALHFGYFSYDEVLHAMSGYTIAQRQVEDLRAKYDAETKRVESEFNAKYEEFLEGQRSFAPTILEKRQAELRELLEKNMAFKAEAQQLLKKAEAEALAPLKTQIDAALEKIGIAKDFAFILNTDNNTVPFINASMGEDITSTLKGMLK